MRSAALLHLLTRCSALCLSMSQKVSIRETELFALPSIVPRIKGIVLRTLASQRFLDDGRVVCAALAAGSHGAAEDQPLATSALKQHVPRMPPIDHAKRHFLGFVISPYNFDDFRPHLFVRRVGWYAGHVYVRFGRAHCSVPPFP
jgi:hypothetical protein